MIVRPARAGDAAAIARLMDQLGHPTTPGSMAERLARFEEDGTAWSRVAEIDGAVVGFAGAFVRGHFDEDGLLGILAALVVDEALRSRGIGAVLVAEAEAWMRERGCRGVVLTSRTHRVDAHRFYERLGYAVNGVRMVKELR